MYFVPTKGWIGTSGGLLTQSQSAVWQETHTTDPSARASEWCIRQDFRKWRLQEVLYGMELKVFGC
jgi:hypothetical protein